MLLGIQTTQALVSNTNSFIYNRVQRFHLNEIITFRLMVWIIFVDMIVQSTRCIFTKFTLRGFCSFMDILNNKHVQFERRNSQIKNTGQTSQCFVHTQGFHSFFREHGFFVFSGLFSGLSFGWLWSTSFFFSSVNHFKFQELFISDDILAFKDFFKDFLEMNGNDDDYFAPSD